MLLATYLNGTVGMKEGQSEAGPYTTSTNLQEIRKGAMEAAAHLGNAEDGPEEVRPRCRK